MLLSEPRRSAASSRSRTRLAGEGFEEVLVFLFLPVLVFQAVLGLSTRSFFSNLAPVLALALVALGISTALVGVALHVGPDVHLAAALVFGSPISATDPVAVVAVFREVDVPRRLLTLVDVGGALGGDRLRGGSRSPTTCWASRG